MLFAAISLPLHNNMTKIVHEFCGICIQRRDIAGCFSGVWGGGLRFGEESCLCIAARLRGIACSWWGRVTGSNRSPPVRRRGGQRNSLSPRQVPPAAVALRNAPAGAALGAPAVFCIALCAIARHSLLVVGRVAGSNHSPPVRRRGVQRNSLARRSGCFLHRALRDCAA